jgi:hypothetical protein
MHLRFLSQSRSVHQKGAAYFDKNAAEVARILLWPTSHVYEPL